MHVKPCTNGACFPQRRGGPGSPVQASLASPLLMISMNLALWNLIVLGFVWVY